LLASKWLSDHPDETPSTPPSSRVSFRAAHIRRRPMSICATPGIPPYFVSAASLFLDQRRPMYPRSLRFPRPQPVFRFRTGEFRLVHQILRQLNLEFCSFASMSRCRRANFALCLGRSPAPRSGWHDEVWLPQQAL
jgi:hypothetical protein